MIDDRSLSLTLGIAREHDSRNSHRPSAAHGFIHALIQSFKTAFLMQSAVCKFEPSCSRYAQEAVRMLPVHVAAIKIIWRVLRCNPFSKGGFDPVVKDK